MQQECVVAHRTFGSRHYVLRDTSGVESAERPRCWNSQDVLGAEQVTAHCNRWLCTDSRRRVAHPTPQRKGR